MTSRRGYRSSSPFDPSAPSAPTSEDIANALYGAPERPPTDRVTATAINLEQIAPDLAQPRRAIPLRFAGSLRDWRDDFEQAAIVDWRALVRGEAEFDPPPDLAHHHREFIDLCSLAASIHRDGLANPITVWRKPSPFAAPEAQRYLIETGERRYMAHWLLKSAVDAQRYSRILAREVPQPDVWRQAAENGARKPLNAVGMARQLALLIMAMYRDEATFDDYDPAHDQAFYAQVADGTRFRIKRGMLERILQVTGLPSRSAIAEYRRILELPPNFWYEADISNWTLGHIWHQMGWRARAKQDDMLGIPNISPNAPTAEAYLSAHIETPTQDDTFEIPNISPSDLGPYQRMADTIAAERRRERDQQREAEQGMLAAHIQREAANGDPHYQRLADALANDDDTPPPDRQPAFNVRDWVFVSEAIGTPAYMIRDRKWARLGYTTHFQWWYKLAQQVGNGGWHPEEELVRVQIARSVARSTAHHSYDQLPEEARRALGLIQWLVPNNELLSQWVQRRVEITPDNAEQLYNEASAAAAAMLQQLADLIEKTLNP